MYIVFVFLSGSIMEVSMIIVDQAGRCEYKGNSLL